MANSAKRLATGADRARSNAAAAVHVRDRFVVQLSDAEIARLVGFDPFQPVAIARDATPLYCVAIDQETRIVTFSSVPPIGLCGGEWPLQPCERPRPQIRPRFRTRA